MSALEREREREREITRNDTLSLLAWQLAVCLLLQDCQRQLESTTMASLAGVSAIRVLSVLGSACRSHTTIRFLEQFLEPFGCWPVPARDTQKTRHKIPDSTGTSRGRSFQPVRVARQPEPATIAYSPPNLEYHSAPSLGATGKWEAAQLPP